MQQSREGDGFITCHCINQKAGAMKHKLNLRISWWFDESAFLRAAVAIAILESILCKYSLSWMAGRLAEQRKHLSESRSVLCAAAVTRKLCRAREPTAARTHEDANEKRWNQIYMYIYIYINIHIDKKKIYIYIYMYKNRCIYEQKCETCIKFISSHVGSVPIQPGNRLPRGFCYNLHEKYRRLNWNKQTKYHIPSYYARKVHEVNAQIISKMKNTFIYTV